jgi:hypothetical protein
VQEIVDFTKEAKSSIAPKTPSESIPPNGKETAESTLSPRGSTEPEKRSDQFLSAEGSCNHHQIDFLELRLASERDYEDMVKRFQAETGPLSFLATLELEYFR